MLLDVLVALLLLAVLLGPLVDGVLATTRRVDALEKSSAAVGVADANESALAFWNWGFGFAQAMWRPGPELVVQASRFDGQKDCRVGLWIQGWFLQEYAVDDAGSLSIGAATWHARSGQEVVLRSRLAGSTWGAPWRTVVPAADGVVAIAASALSPATHGPTSWALHLACVANSAPVLSWSDTQGGPLDLTAPFVRSLPPAGVRQASLGTLAQAWTQEEGRELDLYY